MNEQVINAYVKGFLKAAEAVGLSKEAGYDLLNSRNLLNALGGAGAGAAAGGIGGYLSGDDADPATGRKSTRGRNAMLGFLGGGAVGGLGAGAFTANQDLAKLQGPARQFASRAAALPNNTITQHIMPKSYQDVLSFGNNAGSFADARFPLLEYLTNNNSAGAVNHMYDLAHQ